MTGLSLPKVQEGFKESGGSYRKPGFSLHFRQHPHREELSYCWFSSRELDPSKPFAVLLYGDEEDSPYLTLEMLEIRKPYRGRGLSKELLSYVLSLEASQRPPEKRDLQWRGTSNFTRLGLERLAPYLYSEEDELRKRQEEGPDIFAGSFVKSWENRETYL